MHGSRIAPIALAAALLASAAVAGPWPALDDPDAQDAQDALILAQASTDVVHCHDTARSLVKRVARWRCEGEVVSAEEAERIRQARVERVQRVLQREREPVVPGRRLRGTGTGFFVSASGQLLTNHHVVGDCKAVTVTPAGGDELVASIRHTDPERDLALLETRLSTPGAAVFRDHDELVPNEPVTVVGYPLHGKVVIRPVLASGHIRDDAQPAGLGVFAMNIDIRRGNSGGPVLDDAGRVIGVVVAKVDTPAIYAKTGKLVRDVGLGIRLGVVRDFIRALPVDARTSSADTRLDQAPRFQRARQFVAQVGCWR